MGLDFGEVFSFGFFDWVQKKGLLKYFAAIFVFYIFYTYLSYYFMNALFAPLEKMQMVNDLGFLNVLLYLFMYLIISSVAVWIIFRAINYLLIAKALGTKKLGFVEFTAKRWLNFILLDILNCLAALFSVFKLKYLAIGVTGAGGFLLSIWLINTAFFFENFLIALVGLLVLLIALLVLLAYFVIIVYNFVRLSMSSVIFVEKEIGVMNAIKESWKITNGNARNIFWTLLSIILVISIAGLILYLPAIVHQQGYEKDSKNIRNPFTFMDDPVYLLLTIPSILFEAYSIIVYCFCIVFIYSEVKPVKVFQSAKPSLAAEGLRGKNRAINRRLEKPSKK